MLAGKEAEADFAGREVLIKAKMKAEKVSWDDSAAEQDSIPAQRGPAQAPAAITAPDFGGKPVMTDYDEEMQDAEFRRCPIPPHHKPRKPSESWYCPPKMSPVMPSEKARDC